MRLSFAFVALLSVVAPSGASPARTVAPRDELRLVFLDADDAGSVRSGAASSAAIDVGRVVADNCANGCMRTIVKRRFRLRVEGGTARLVRVRAFVQDNWNGQRVRIDGRTLSSMPQLIDAAVPMRVAVTHTLEIDVPTSEPPGALSHSIVWLAEEVQ